jgi:hypothetical protein
MNIVRPTFGRNSTSPCITIVEADSVLAVALSHNLNAEGYAVENIDRGDEAARKLPTLLPILSSLNGCCPACLGPKFVPGCGRRTRRDPNHHALVAGG